MMMTINQITCVKHTRILHPELGTYLWYPFVAVMLTIIIKYTQGGQALWLKPVILATQEVEIGRIAV
jgi:hypothetical protein